MEVERDYIKCNIDPNDVSSMTPVFTDKLSKDSKLKKKSGVVHISSFIFQEVVP